MFIRVLEGLHQPEGLVNRASHRQVIHGDLSEDTFIIDDEETSTRQQRIKPQNSAGKSFVLYWNKLYNQGWDCSLEIDQTKSILHY